MFDADDVSPKRANVRSLLGPRERFVGGLVPTNLSGSEVALLNRNSSDEIGMQSLEQFSSEAIRQLTSGHCLMSTATIFGC